MGHRSAVDVFLLLRHEDRALFALRRDTGYADGQWNLPSGKVEPDEHGLAAIVRESAEEIGLRCSPDELSPAWTLHYRPPEGEARIGLFFALAWDPDRHGTPVNAEPHKCGGVGWYPLDRPPAPLEPYTRAGLALYRSGAGFGIAGWERGENVGGPG